jgi:predicted O-methyltransferase YrrM
MTTLKLLIENQFTDKDQGHCFCELYDTLFEPIKSTASNIMEIGVDKGGSILLWSQYFTNPDANIYGVDCSSRYCMNPYVLDRVVQDKRVQLVDSVDAYLPTTASPFYVNNIKFDIIIDDGPHTYLSNKVCLQLYSQLLSEKGILVIEDIQDYNYLYSLFEHVPDELKKYVEVYDLRDCINQYDDVLFVINKSGIIPTEAYGGKLTPVTSNIGTLNTLYKWIKN